MSSTFEGDDKQTNGRNLCLSKSGTRSTFATAGIQLPNQRINAREIGAKT
jgi:hypothetical protein